MGCEREGSKTPPDEASEELKRGPLTRTAEPPLPPCPWNTQQPPPLARSSACAAPLEQRRLRANGGGEGEGDRSFPWEAPMDARKAERRSLWRYSALSARCLRAS